MGMVISFTRVTLQELEQARRDPEGADQLLAELGEKPDEPDGYLDKAWSGIQFLLDAADVEVDLQMGGEPLDEEGTLYAWSANLVEKTAAGLLAAPFDQLARHYDPAKMIEEEAGDGDPEELEYLREYHEILVDFFKVTAASGSAAIMCSG